MLRLEGQLSSAAVAADVDANFKVSPLQSAHLNVWFLFIVFVFAYLPYHSKCVCVCQMNVLRSHCYS